MAQQQQKQYEDLQQKYIMLEDAHAELQRYDVKGVMLIISRVVGSNCTLRALKLLFNTIAYYYSYYNAIDLY
jgi:hypothetical protein